MRTLQRGRKQDTPSPVTRYTMAAESGRGHRPLENGCGLFIVLRTIFLVALSRST